MQLPGSAFVRHRLAVSAAAALLFLPASGAYGQEPRTGDREPDAGSAAATAGTMGLPLAGGGYATPGVRHSPDVPTPRDVLGHRVGARHTSPAGLVQYFRAVGEASERVVVGRHGATYEGRLLVHAIVTSPANHSRLEEIRRAHLRLSEAPETVSDAELAGMPAVVYLGYSIHGNEASGSDASLLVLYHLASGTGAPSAASATGGSSAAEAGALAPIETLLDSLVIIIDPSMNPDGRAHFTSWVNANRGGTPVADPQDREHDEPWPGGRGNHYWFDLNRDWLLAQHPVSRGRLEVFHRWRPQLFTDHHEMGGDRTFFFQPGIPSRNNPDTPERVYELTERLAAFHARRLDRRGSLYYTRESYDDFYFGKGSTYPDINGAVGILFEQASSRALRRETDRGLLTYPQTIANHVSASLSSLRGALALRVELLDHQRDFYRNAVAEAREGDIGAWVIGAGERRTRGQRLARLFRRHRIRVHALAEPVDVDGERFEPGEAYVIPATQPQARLLEAMMERVTEFQDSLFYDVSTWTMPLAFGVRVASVEGSADAFLGEELTEIPLDGGAVIGGEADYAYVMEWDRFRAPAALWRLHEAGLQPLLATRPFEGLVGGDTARFERGAIIVQLGPRNAQRDIPADSVHRLVRRLAEEEHVVLHAAATGLTPVGPDLGGPSMRTLRKPAVALVVGDAPGDGVSAYEAGEAWHLLSERMGIPVSLVDVRDLTGRPPAGGGDDGASGGLDLSRYNTLVLVSGEYGDPAGEMAERLRQWVRRGGALIAIREGARWAVEVGLVNEELVPEPSDTLRVPYADVEAARGAQQIGGTIFEVRLDVTHPLAFGHDSTVAVFRTGTTLFRPSAAAGAMVGRYTDSPLLSGYASDRNLERIPGTAAIIAREVGRGSVVLFADDPNFRAFWYGTMGLFLNAVFFAGAI